MATVLIVEDRAEIQTLLRAVVARAGHETLVAGTASEARALLVERPRLVFVDLGLPGQSGIELVLHMRSLPAAVQPGVVVVTADPDATRRLEAAGLLGIEVILKPFRFARVAGIMERYLTREGKLAHGPRPGRR